MESSLTAGSERMRRFPETVFATEPRKGSLDGTGVIAAEGDGALEGVVDVAAGVGACAEAADEELALGFEEPHPARIVTMTMAAVAARPICHGAPPTFSDQPWSITSDARAGRLCHAR